MNIKRILRWADLLDSGEFTQQQRMLSNAEGTKYCCLGVACELYSVERGGYWEPKSWCRIFVAEPDLSAGVGLSIGAVPTVAGKWFGLNPEETQQMNAVLIRLNDLEGRDFHEIAQYLRAQTKLPPRKRWARNAWG